MKKIAVLIAAICCVQFGQAQFSRVTLVASGLTCSMCSKAVYKSLSGVPFVESVTSNIKESSYQIFLKTDMLIDFDAIRKAVEDAGFSVAKMQVVALFSNIEIGNDTHIVLGGENLHFLNVPQETLNGTFTLTLVDKKFTPDKEYKKYMKYTTMKCFTTGVMESCCKDGATGKRIYHVTIQAI